MPDNTPVYKFPFCSLVFCSLQIMRMNDFPGGIDFCSWGMAWSSVIRPSRWRHRGREESRKVQKVLPSSEIHRDFQNVSESLSSKMLDVLQSHGNNGDIHQGWWLCRRTMTERFSCSRGCPDEHVGRGICGNPTVNSHQVEQGSDLTTYDCS